MRNELVLLLVLASVASAFADGSSGVAATSIGVASPISSDSSFSDAQCDVNQSLIDSMTDSIINDLNLDYSFKNVTNTYCYNYGDYSSVSVNVDLKESAESYKSKKLSFSYYVSTDYDYSVLFNKVEDEKLDYNLKRKYVDYLENGTDDEYYVSISPSWGEKSDCTGLKAFFDSLSGEKYFNEENDYCSAVVKTRTSQVKSLASDVVGYVSYFTDNLSFTFTGYSEGSYDLSALSKSLDCDLSVGDSYFVESAKKCYGIYKSDERAHVSVYSNSDDLSVSMYAYGFVGGDGIITVNAYGKSIDENAVLNFVKENTLKYLGTSYTLTLTSDKGFSGEYSSVSGKARVSNFRVADASLSGLKYQEGWTDDYYWNDNVSVSITKPYIQIIVSDPIEEAQTVSSEKALVPYPWSYGKRFVITPNKVFSSVTIDSNDALRAESEIKGLVDSYVTTGSWVLNMSVGGNYYPYPLMRAGGVDEGVKAVSSGSGIAAEESTSSDTSGVLGVSQLSRSASTPIGSPQLSSAASDSSLQDGFSEAFPEFSELEKKNDSLIDRILNFFKGLLG